jgi:hypothetical protein
MERRKQENSTLQKTNNSIEDLVGNEENEYPGPNPIKTMINMTNVLTDIQKNLSKRKSWMRKLRYSWRSYKGQLNRMYRMKSNNNKTPQIINL